jgi:hypothetical protein
MKALLFGSIVMLVCFSCTTFAVEHGDKLVSRSDVPKHDDLLALMALTATEPSLDKDIAGPTHAPVGKMNAAEPPPPASQQPVTGQPQPSPTVKSHSVPANISDVKILMSHEKKANEVSAECSELHAASVQPPFSYRIALLVVAGVYTLVTLGSMFLVKTMAAPQSMKIRCSSLLAVEIVLQNALMWMICGSTWAVQLALPIEIFWWGQVFVAPMIIICHGLRLTSLRAKYDLHKLRRALTCLPGQTKPPSAANGRKILTPEETSFEIGVARRTTEDRRFHKLFVMACVPLALAAVLLQCLTTPCKELSSPLLTQLFAISSPAVAVGFHLTAAILTRHASNAFMVKTELYVLLVANLSLSVQSCVRLLTSPGVHGATSLHGVLHTYHVAVVMWLCLLLVINLGSVLIAHIFTPKFNKHAQFESMFGASGETMKEDFTEFLHREFAGGLMMLHDDIGLFRKKFKSDSGGSGPTDAVTKAQLRQQVRTIWYKYLVPNAPMEVDLDPATLFEVNERISSNSVSVVIFDAVAEMTEQELRARFARFAPSPKMIPPSKHYEPL